MSMPRIGILSSAQSPPLDGFYRGLRELGYIEGKNILIERRFTGNDVRMALGHARELAALNVNVIYASSSTFVEAAHQVTTTIPIVFSNHNDPVGTGHVSSLSHPGGNITGVSQMGTDLDAKQLQLVKELFQQLTRVAVLSNPTTPSHLPALKKVAEAGSNLGLQLHMLKASTLEQIELAFESASKAGDQALVLLTSPLAFAQRQRIAAFALKHRMPAMFGQRDFAEAGGLISYGADLTELNRRTASYVDKILKGARPADLAIEQPTKFELTVNLKTAKALGIKIPQSLLLRADLAIE
jgi:putative ABC transport system substrate-binding protein